jgi:hypothetical protein
MIDLNDKDDDREFFSELLSELWSKDTIFRCSDKVLYSGGW